MDFWCCSRTSEKNRIGSQFFHSYLVLIHILHIICVHQDKKKFGTHENKVAGRQAAAAAAAAKPIPKARRALSTQRKTHGEKKDKRVRKKESTETWTQRVISVQSFIFSWGVKKKRTNRECRKWNHNTTKNPSVNYNELILHPLDCV